MAAASNGPEVVKASLQQSKAVGVGGFDLRARLASGNSGTRRSPAAH